jgi:immunity protein 49 of polymorphic toxin system
MKRHDLLPASHFEMLRGVYRDLVATTFQQLKDGSGVPQLCYKTLVRMSLANGCIALILEQPDEEARRHFVDAATHALQLLDAPGARGGGVRAYEANVEVSEDGARVTSLHEKRPEAGLEKLSITDFHQALISVVSFGERTSFGRIASFPEDRYRNPGTVASEEYWSHLRAWKALLRGDEAGARKEAEASVAKAGKDEPAHAALLALLQSDARGLSQSLDAELKAHNKRFKKQASEPLGAVCFPVLTVARIAIERGMKVEEDPYVPVRLLPNYAAGLS